MRGASRASLAEARQQLSAAVTSATAARTLGDELFAVVTLLDAEPAVRRALTDGSRPADARTGLARDLLGGRVGDATLDLVATLAAGQWSGPADLSEAVEQLAVLSISAAAERGRHLDDLEDQLFRFGRVVAGAPELRTVLSNPDIPADFKRGLLDSLLEGKATPDARRLIAEAAVHSRGRNLDASLTEYARLAAQWRERLIAVVRVAIALSAEQHARLAAALEAAYGHEIHLNVIVDPNLVGGISVRIGDEFIDGSVASRLAELRRRLVA
ncbi:MAG: F-type H+-transporting ATPase subunit delta [Streptosporangiaceae bacterium]|nr:F-type H+-transporting ATPase subunit delta [Streptosporangiaceae bacterium]